MALWPRLLSPTQLPHVGKVQVDVFVVELPEVVVGVVQQSPHVETFPVPVSKQPQAAGTMSSLATAFLFVNAAVEVAWQICAC